ncbi:AHH domain-containing protein, partial [Stenotrophomonas sp. 278]|uniref:AHH domain-containing protein n=1 Tax=Stenotrophomonas sp. 278 TaxID=2479851 RepID=UPI000FADD3D8
MSPSPVLLQSHHVIEQSFFKNDLILIQLVEAKLIDPHSSKNRLYLPFDDALANEIETPPHRGKTASSYTRSVGAVLGRLASTDDGRLLQVDGGASPEAREAALRRIAEKISDLQDTIKVAIVNGDAFPTIPGRIEKSDAVGTVRNFVFGHNMLKRIMYATQEEDR